MPARTLVCRALLASTAVLCINIGVAHADDAQALKDRLRLAEKDTSLAGDDVQPFYLKMSVQLFDAKGAPADQGEVELYWASPSKEKLVYSFPSYTATEVHIDDKVFRTSGSGVPPARAAQLVGLILHPMAQISEIDRSEPQVQKVTMGKVQLDCIILAKPIGGAPVTVGLFPTYCLDPTSNSLRASIAPGGQIVLHNLMNTFQQRHVAQDVVITTRGVQAAEGKIESLEGRAVSDADLVTDGLVLAPRAAVVVAGGVIAGLVLTKQDPVYPLSSKTRHSQGVVVLHAQIGKDGRIHDLEVVSSPDPDLSAAAMDAVKTWTYRPYLLNGDPVSVETTISVSFNLGHQ